MQRCCCRHEETAATFWLFWEKHKLSSIPHFWGLHGDMPEALGPLNFLTAMNRHLTNPNPSFLGVSGFQDSFPVFSHISLLSQTKNGRELVGNLIKGFPVMVGLRPDTPNYYHFHSHEWVEQRRDNPRPLCLHAQIWSYFEAVSRFSKGGGRQEAKFYGRLSTWQLLWQAEALRLSAALWRVHIKLTKLNFNYLSIRQIYLKMLP